MTGSAQREMVAESEPVALEEEGFVLTEPRAELKRQVAERLAAHRRRTGSTREESALAPQRQEAGQPRSPAAGAGRRKHAAATAVAERYAQTPSYRAFLAEQAQRAVEEAAAKAEVARRNAEAAAAVQQELLTELALWDAPQEFTRETAGVVAAAERSGREADASAPLRNDRPGVLTVRLYEDLGAPPAVAEAKRAGAEQAAPDAAEAEALEAEIDFRKAPVFEDYKALLDRDEAAPIPLPANLLEFPRQLVAARRARPRLAEGPLREEAPRSPQLRIFEVEAGQISPAPVVPAPAEWTTIRLDAPATTVSAAPESGMPVLASLLPPQTAPLALRAMAGLVDAGLVLAGTVAFVAVFAKVAGAVPSGWPALLASGGVATALYLLYQVLFFTLSEQTPGMRYARIGLCTLTDENPTRAAMRRRILAQLVAVCPMGLGLLWSLLDDDGLGWHDRISRMYQRAY